MQGASTVTLLFTDLVGSTELRMAVGENVADRLREEHDRLLVEAIAAHGGKVVKGTGDGIIATFLGAADAVNAAVTVQQAVHAWDTGAVGRQLVRVGLSAGDVTWDGGDCFGAPVIEAARLCAAADGGQILAADVVRVLARGRHGNTMAALGALDLKGLSEPVTTYEVSWTPLHDEDTAGSVPLPAALRTDREFPFAGRGDELDRLLDHWSATKAGDRRLVLIAGEPGIGKTRLAAELANRAQDDGATVLYGRCDEDMGFSYQPFVDALQYFVGASNSATLQAQLGPHGGDLVRLCPDLEALAPDLSPALQSDPEAERYRLFDAVAGWLRAMSEHQPALIVLDDLHGAATPALQLLRHVLRNTEGCRLLIVATYRDTELGRTEPLADTLAEIRPLAGVERLSLVGLDENELAVLLGQPSDSTLTTAVYAETEGNPLFTREVLRHLQESGTITRRDDRWVADQPIEKLGIPEGVREVIGRRLVHLSPSTNETLSHAAVVGSEFTLSVLASMSGTDADDVAAALDEAIAARLLVEVGIGSYRFSHALIRSTLYDELGLTTRVRLHRRVGIALETVQPDDVLGLAHHFGSAAAAGEEERTARYTLLAARQAQSALATDGATTLARTALDLLDGIHNDELRCDALTCLGEAQRIGADPEHRETLLAAGRLAVEMGDRDRLVTATLANAGGVGDTAGVDGERIDLIEAALVAIGPDDSADRARLLALLAYQLAPADAHERFGLADDALAMARKVGDRPALTYVLHLCFEATRAPHMLDQLLVTSEENVALAEELGDPVALGWAISDNGWARGCYGDVNAMFESIQRAGVIGDACGVGVFRRVPYLARAWRAHHEGRLEEADVLAHEAFQVFTETGHRSAFAFYAGQLLAIRRDQGRLDELLPLVGQVAAENPTIAAFQTALCLIHADLDQPDEALSVLRTLAAGNFGRIPYDWLWLQATCNCAEVSAALGDRATATVLYDLLVPYHAQFAFVVSSVGAVARFVGAVAATIERFDEADAFFHEAVEIEQTAGAVVCVARTQVDWARMLLTRGKPGDADRARALLDEAIATAQTVGLLTVERRARELLQA